MGRLVRSVVDLAQIVTELTGRGVRVGFATFRLHLLGAAAQLERSPIRERQREGIALAKERGVYRGRARRLDEAAAAEARRLAGEGLPKAKIARDLGCSRRVLYDALAGTGAYASPALSDVS